MKMENQNAKDENKDERYDSQRKNCQNRSRFCKSVEVITFVIIMKDLIY